MKEKATSEECMWGREAGVCQPTQGLIVKRRSVDQSNSPVQTTVKTAIYRVEAELKLSSHKGD